MTDLREQLPDLQASDLDVRRSDLSVQRAARLATLPLVPSGPKSPASSEAPLGSVKGVWQYRELLGLLVRRELKSRYKDSALGFLWSLVRPLMMMIVYVVAIGLFLGASYNSITKTGTVDFPVYIFSGLTVWNLFSEIVGVGTGSRSSTTVAWSRRSTCPARSSRSRPSVRPCSTSCIQLAHPVHAPPGSPASTRHRRSCCGRSSVPHWCWSGPRRWRSCCPRSTCTCGTSPTSWRSCCCSVSGLSPVVYQLAGGAGRT